MGRRMENPQRLPLLIKIAFKMEPGREVPDLVVSRAWVKRPAVTTTASSASVRRGAHEKRTRARFNRSVASR